MHAQCSSMKLTKIGAYIYNFCYHIIQRHMTLLTSIGFIHHVALKLVSSWNVFVLFFFNPCTVVVVMNDTLPLKFIKKTLLDCLLSWEGLKLFRSSVVHCVLVASSCAKAGYQSVFLKVAFLTVESQVIFVTILSQQNPFRRLNRRHLKIASNNKPEIILVAQYSLLKPRAELLKKTMRLWVRGVLF